MKMALMALVVFLTVGIILSGNLLTQFGVDKNYLYIGLGAIVITGLVAFRGAILISIVLLMSLMINMPQEFLDQYLIDKFFSPWFIGSLQEKNKPITSH